MIAQARHGQMNHQFQQSSLNRQLTLPDQTLNESVKTVNFIKNPILLVLWVLNFEF